MDAGAYPGPRSSNTPFHNGQAIALLILPAVQTYSYKEMGGLLQRQCKPRLDKERRNSCHSGGLGVEFISRRDLADSICQLHQKTLGCSQRELQRTDADSMLTVSYAFQYVTRGKH